TTKAMVSPVVVCVRGYPAALITAAAPDARSRAIDAGGSSSIAARRPAGPAIDVDRQHGARRALATVLGVALCQQVERLAALGLGGFQHAPPTVGSHPPQRVP